MYHAHVVETDELKMVWQSIHLRFGPKQFKVATIVIHPLGKERGSK